MRTLTLILLLLSFFSIPLGRSDAAVESRHPNVLIVLADDQGWGDLSSNGNTNLATPNIDTLGKNGVVFDRFYACPLCSPTRAELLTGRYHTRGGVTGVTTGRERLNLDEKTIADSFLAAGYTTAVFGKWHNGSQYPYHPAGRGFQEFYGFTSGHWGSYFSPMLEHNGNIVRGNGYLTDDLTDHVLKFIETNREKPFFCYLALNIPHTPFQVPDKYWEKYRNHPLQLRGRTENREEIEGTRCALAMCENIDWNIGRITEKLAALNLESDTIIVYLSDNGPNGWRWNDDMKGRKGQVDEGGVRVPCIMQWKGKLDAGKKIHDIAGMIDILPTFLNLADIKRVGDAPLDGKDLSPLLFGTGNDWPDRTIVSQTGSQLSIRSNRFRLDPKGNLFDMQTDPGQRENVAAKFPEAQQRLTAELNAWKQSVRFSEPSHVKPIPVGYVEFPWVPLPARDANFSGKIKRSAGAPNCSYLTSWTSPSDKIDWNLDVNLAGKYDVIVYYTCPESELGSTIELSCGTQSVQGTITTAFDPPLETGLDRVNRGSESYVKDFKEWKFGQLSLETGLQSIELRAVRVAGNAVGDLRGISLTLVDE